MSNASSAPNWDIMLQCAQICKKARKLSPRDKEALPKEDVLAAAKWDTELQLAHTSQANPEVPDCSTWKFRF